MSDIGCDLYIVLEIIGFLSASAHVSRITGAIVIL